jgi:methyl-accepting chemotaxis protein
MTLPSQLQPPSDRATSWRQWFANLPLTAQLNLALAGLLLLMGAVILGITQASLRRNASHLLDARRVRELALTSQALLLTQDDITKAMLLNPDKMDLAAGKVEAYDSSQKIFLEMDSLAGSAEISTLIAELHRFDENQLRPVDTRILEKISEGDIPGATRIYFAEYDTLRAGYGTIVIRLGTVADSVARAAVSRLESQNRLAIALSLLLGFGLVSLGVALFGQRIRRRLDVAVGQLERVATGNLTESIPADSRDEIGRIATALNQTTASLRSIIGEIQSTSDYLIRRSREIASAAGESENGVKALDEAIRQVADGTQEQARTSAETAGVMNQLSGAIQGVARQVREVTEAESQRVSQARTSAEAVRRAIHKIEEIREPVLETAAQVQELGSRTEQIGIITKTIASIAEGTNMLAVNAAIQAAHAGDQGRGFGVVAAEVRRLAGDSAAASAHIATIIQDIGDRTQSAMAAVESGTARVRQSAEDTRSAEPGLVAILDGLGETNRQLQEVTVATLEMLKQVTRVSSLVDDMAAVCEESAASAEEISAQSHEVSQAIARIMTMATARTEEKAAASSENESLVEGANRLGRLVSGFRV